MKNLKSFALILMAVVGFAAMPAFADDTSQNQPNADNSVTNTRDRNADEVTADQGSNQKSDRDIMAQIRKSVVADKSLSTYAQNVKIISVNGKVTLKGPVRSDDESKNIKDKATQVAGTGNVTNNLSVKPTH